ncbi:hypothetical protein BDP27DRAFT_1415239 [Rhodocollybia butyracea]|uniref:Uncharacterized protein n=1 Tax=Rhodocollybia butyracea TaxID=206335 RepID=A0A9P5UDR6_9AGAR|nr:hypothetical protein BDP27DRAFT_1415239 [Rhodocollybia butyracea]
MAPTSSSNSSSIPTGTIVFGVVVGILVALLLAVITYLVIRQWRRRKLGNARPKHTSRGIPLEGAHLLLRPADLQAGQTEYNPYSDQTNWVSFHRPAHPNTNPEIEPMVSHSSMMHEIPTPSSPRPSLPPLVIPPNADQNEIHSADSVDDASARSSPSAYSQASASTRHHTKIWERENAKLEAPPVPLIPSQYQNYPHSEIIPFPEEDALVRGNTEKVSRLLQSRARHARRGKSLSRSATQTSHIERADSLDNAQLQVRDSAQDTDGMDAIPESPTSLTIRNPFENTSSRSTSATSSSITNYTAHYADPPYAHRLPVIHNEEEETESLYADEIPSTRPLVIMKQ